MSLNWNIARTEWAKQDTQAREQEWPVVQAVIWATAVLGVSGITKRNVSEVIARLRFYEALRGGFLTQQGKDIPVPESLVRSLIGLTTNVSPESWASFARRIAASWHADQLR